MCGALIGLEKVKKPPPPTLSPTERGSAGNSLLGSDEKLNPN